MSWSWLGEILLNSTKNIVQQLHRIVQWIYHFYPVKNGGWNTLSFEQPEPNLGRAGQYQTRSHKKFSKRGIILKDALESNFTNC